MKTKKWLALMFVAAGCLCLSAKNTSQNDVNGQNGPKNGSNGQGMMNQRTDCSQLTPDEQDFANQLNPSNKMVFCSKFNADMRTSAIEMSGQMGPDGTLITNDQAVEQVAKDNNMGMPMAPPAARQGGSCPAK